MGAQWRSALLSCSLPLCLCFSPKRSSLGWEEEIKGGGGDESNLRHTGLQRLWISGCDVISPAREKKSRHILGSPRSCCWEVL
jgi:hypothetical protein